MLGLEKAETQDWDPTPGVDPTALQESDISVAIMYTGGRAEKMIVPLQATEMEVDIEPDHPWTYDVMLLDNADRYMVWPVIRKNWPTTDTKVVYRMRGNVYEELARWDMNPFKEHLAKLVLANADGFICVNEGMATIASRRAKIEPVGVAGLAKRLDEWPTVNHTAGDIHGITLTNNDYIEKAEPLVRYGQIVDEFFDEHGGHWDIYGEGLHSEWLTYATDQFDHIDYVGYTETPDVTIAKYNVMFHFSELDALPNSILEGLASNLPVITNDFYAFTESPAPLEIVHDRSHLLETLNRLQVPETRQAIGADGRSYIGEYHTPDYVGEQYVEYFKRLLNHDGN